MTGLLLGSTATPTTPTDVAGRMNRLRAGVLGANDGIVSVAAIVFGVAGVAATERTLLAAGLAALIGGALSMALGEYVSVSSQRDGERAAGHDGSGANPVAAAAASALSFVAGGVLPLLAVLLAQGAARLPATAVVAVLALAATGALGARLGGAPMARPTVRVVVGGLAALLITFGIGRLLGATGLV